MLFRVSLFWLCAVIPSGICEYSVVELADKLQNLERKLDVLTNTVDQLTSENEDLRGRIDILEGINSHKENNENQPKQVSGTKGFPVHDMQDSVELRSSKEMVFVRNQKRIVPPTIMPAGVIAFHAYLSKDSDGPVSTHHILKYDIVPLNKGNGYNVFDGIFIVPTAGTYVFTWSFMCDPHGRVNTELMKNADVIGTRVADSASSTVWDFSTGSVVVDVAQGDHVYVRLATTSWGIVKSLSSSRTSFSGWLLN